MNIVTHTRELVSKADEEISSGDLVLKQAGKEIAATEKKLSELATTKDRLMAEGLNKNEVELKMQELEEKRVVFLEKQSTQQATVEAAKAARSALDALELLAQLCDEKLNQVEIPELGRICDFQAQLSVELRFQEGVAKTCRLWIGESNRPVREFELPVKSSIDQVRRGIVPAALKWVPSEWLPVRSSNSNRHESDSAIILVEPKVSALSELYFIGETRTWVPLRPDIQWMETERRSRNPHDWNSPQDEVSVMKKVKWGVSEDALGEQLAKKFEECVLDLDRKSEDPFLAMVEEKIREATQPVDQTIYARNTVLLKTGEIEKRIGASFRQFVDAPWTAETKGLWANLKYYCEQGERPRFYCCEVDGAYGFRLRTRDHNWIRGRLYVVPDALPYESGSSDVPEIQKNYGSSVLVRLGRLILKVEDETVG